MHACPCCGYQTLPGRGDYDLCPVCWWEDEGTEPWEYSGPNGQTLVEAQQEFLARRRPYRLRPKVRAPRPDEAREPGWRPIELTDDLQRRVAEAHAEQERQWAEESERVAREIAEDPEGPFKEYNAASRALRAEAPRMPYDEVEARLRELNQAHGVLLPDPYVELIARRMQDEHYYRRHPLRAAAWLMRHSRPSTVVRRWRELRTGRVTFAG